MEELSCTLPDRFWYPLGLWLGLEERVLRDQLYCLRWELEGILQPQFYGSDSKKSVLDTFQDCLIRQTALPKLITESLYQQIIKDSYMTMKKANEVVEQIEDSNKESVRSCLHGMLIKREETITMALVKIGLEDTAEELKGQQ